MNEAIFSKCMLLVLEQHSCGQSRKIRKERLEVVKHEGEHDAQDKAWAASKKIFGASNEFAAIGQLDGQVRTQLDALALPAQFQRGTFAIPTGLVPKAQQVVNAYLEQRQALVDTFLESYEGTVLEQKALLGALWDVTDYPSRIEVGRRFSVTSRWLSLGVPGQLEEIDPDLYQQQVASQKAAIEETLEEVRMGLRAALKGLIDHLLNRLANKGDDGKVKHLRPSAVTNIVEFLELLPAKNVTGDLDLQTLATRAHSIVTAMDVEELREPGVRRAVYEKQLTQLTGQLDALIESAPARKFGGFSAAKAEDAA